MRGVKNFWKRFGVMGGGFLSLRLPVFVTCDGGELGSSVDMRRTHGEEDMTERDENPTNTCTTDEAMEWTSNRNDEDLDDEVQANIWPTRGEVGSGAHGLARRVGCRATAAGLSCSR